MSLFIGFSATLALVGVVLLTFSAVYDSGLLEVIASVLLAPSLVMIFAVNIYALKRSKPETFTFDKIVRK